MSDEDGTIAATNTSNKKLFSFRFDESLITQIDCLAKNTHRTRTQLLTDLMLIQLSSPHTNESISNPLY